ncbi:hypothetical protein N7533_009633 [Penicillium manginii]|uniref:uncharacterized protein n=1 Tax=Penicillium manginii TaxID=203109 RepID=UPI00254754BE|nr:uncharacterized protein N7533_009633 [Penicillium manginii]KAJ5744763.1 hypothetical protein N7533_009633 [Penicillium manginii]
MIGRLHLQVQVATTSSYLDYLTTPPILIPSMAVSAFPSAGDSPDITLLNAARLFTRLEYNLLSPAAELRNLRKSEYQRLRVTKNVEYARTLLTQLERSLPQLKQPDRRHEAQAEIARDRQLLKRMQTVLDEEEADARADENGDDVEDEDEEDDEWKELFSKPIVEKRVVSSTPDVNEQPHTLRNRHAPTTAPKESSAKTTGSSTTPADSKIAAEKALDDDRSEQEDLTSSLVAMASQLKSQSQSFQETLDNEKDALDRASLGMDKTSSTMEAAGRRMSMLTRMSEGKGWWGRMMLYAWIFGLWIVAILIVYVGPKLRF